MVPGYLFISGTLMAAALLISALQKLNREEVGAAYSLIAAVLAWLWPVLLPLLLVFAVWRMVVFVLKTLTDIVQPDWMPDILWGSYN